MSGAAGHIALGMALCLTWTTTRDRVLFDKRLDALEAKVAAAQPIDNGIDHRAGHEPAQLFKPAQETAPMAGHLLAAKGGDTNEPPFAVALAHGAQNKE